MLHVYRDKTMNFILINKTRKRWLHFYLRPAFLFIILAFLHLQTVLPFFWVCQNKLCFKIDVLKHYNMSSFKFACWQRWRKLCILAFRSWNISFCKKNPKKTVRTNILYIMLQTYTYGRKKEVFIFNKMHEHNQFIAINI